MGKINDYNPTGPQLFDNLDLKGLVDCFGMQIDDSSELDITVYVGVTAWLSLSAQENENRLEVFICPLMSIFLFIVAKEFMIIIIVPNSRKPIDGLLQRDSF